jgi:hypothetical protein
MRLSLGSTHRADATGFWFGNKPALATDAVIDALCGSLCDLCASVVSVFFAISPQRHGEPQSSHREIVNSNSRRSS